MRLTQTSGTYSIVRFEPQQKVPEWVWSGAFTSVSKTQNELSIVCESKYVPATTQKVDGEWSVLKVEGPLNFSLVGVLSSIVKPLADEGVSIFAISTFDTDYILVKSVNLSKAASLLEYSGHQVILD